MESLEKSTQRPVRARGFWLSAYIVLAVLSNILGAYIYFSNPDAPANAYPKATVGFSYLLGFLCICNVLFAVLIWFWKKAGVYGFYLIVAIALVVNLYLGVGLLGSIPGLVGGLIVYITTKKRWEHFE